MVPKKWVVEGIEKLAAGLNLTEEFLVLFNALKMAAGGEPQRVSAFYKESKSIRDTHDALQAFLDRSDLERRVFHGGKLVVQRAAGFETAWKEYAGKWRFRVTWPALPNGFLDRMLDSLLGDSDSDPDGSTRAALEERAWKEAQIERIEADSKTPELVSPEPETEDSFDPVRHDGGAAIELGIQYLDFARAGAELDPEWRNRCSIALDAYDYLTNTIGLDVGGIFRRWRNVPVVFMPAHVSNRYGARDKGSLPHLLNDAVRAYVFGAPAAAFAMCRAAYDMVKDRHYQKGQLDNVIVLASQEYDFINKDNIGKWIKKLTRFFITTTTINR